ncbi:MAG: glycerate kinase [Halanaerobiales bacterium]|nr:glycerate kinase [Halanaerobiales bacterium]
MKVLIAPDSFKGSLSALEVSENIEKGILMFLSDAEIIKVPMADGGEGTVQSLTDATNGKKIYKTVTNPLGEPIEAYFGILGDGKTAVIEMATASGLPLIPFDKADPSKTTTYGTGELIKAALDEGELNRIESIDMSGLDPRINEVKIKVACDVTNLLYGPNGAAYVYAPQKGADPEMVKMLDDNLRYFADVVQKVLGKDIQNIPGSGAAGGLGAGLVTFLNAELKSGVEIVLNVNELREKMKDVDLVITGEGKIDNQTVNGKTPIGVAKIAKEFGIPVIAIVGTVDDHANLVINAGIDAIFSIIQKPVSMEKAIEKTPKWLQLTSEHVMRVFNLGGFTK